MERWKRRFFGYLYYIFCGFFLFLFDPFRNKCWQSSLNLSGPPSFSNPAQANNGPAGPNNVGLTSPGPHPHQQQPNRPPMSPTSSSGPPMSNSDFQPSYNGTELVMLYDYKVSSRTKYNNNSIV